MDMLDQISEQIAVLDSGEKWTLSAQDLLFSGADFHSISVFLSLDSEKGFFSIEQDLPKKQWFQPTEITITKH